MKQWILILLLSIAMGLLLNLYATPTKSESGSDPNCVLISQDGVLKTFYCFNPESNGYYYRNNYGFIAID